MLVQFESKSARVKGVSFHPRRPWLLASLHNGAVQLLDYRMSTLIDTYVEHEGPVRGIAFHPTQPLFVSGGDDYKIKVFNYQLRRCLFTLLGHLDYVRTVQFHHESPWIVSASDDQTVRIWNWQNRSCLAVLTGHNHYVMSACFHPLEDLVLSASLDQTVRVWDISGLSGSGTAAAAAAAAAAAGIPAAALAYGSGGGGGGVGMGGGSGFPGRGPFGARTSPGGANDLFGGASTDVAVKFVLEGHARGVNWAAFHPTMPLIVSGADDRQIKLWRYSETRAWEVDTLRGHLNNVSCVLFHPHLDLIVSDSEDRTIRVWDMARRACIATYRRDADRFWVLTVHPRLRILAAGHDSGAMVLKLQRERPAYAIAPDGRMVYTRERYVRVLDLNTGRDAPVCVARGRLPTGGGGGGSWPGSGAVEGGGVLGPPPRYLGYNPVEHAVLLQYDADGGTYELYVLPKGDDGGGAAVDAVEPRSGAASSAVFVGRNRFATLERNVLVVRDLHNAATKRVPVPLPGAERLFSAGAGYVFIASDERVALFDIQKRRVLAELNAPGIKYAVWSDDAHRVAFLAKHTLWLASRQLDRMASVHETVRIKSAAWDESGVLLYTTLNHLKYCLPNGDTGIVCTLAEPVYLTYARGPAVATIDRDGQPGSLAIDPTEYTFKLLLLRKRYDAVRRAIEEARMPGQAMISYLQRKGYPEIALLFVQDDQTRFALALDSGHLDEALSAAQRLDRAEVWEALAGKALAQGRVQMAELCYQKSKNLQRLAFLYVVTGELDKLEKLGQIAQSRQDSAAQLQIALLLGDTETPARVLRECGLTALAETAERVMETGATTLLPPEPVDDAMPGGDWPLLPQPRDLFERDPNAPEGDHAWDEERFRPTGEFYEAALGAHEATATEWEEDEQQQQQQQQQRQVGMVERGSAGSRSAPEVAPIAAAVAAMSVAEGGEESGWGDTLDALDVPLSPTVDTAPEAGSATEEAEEMTAAGEAWSEAAADEWTETAAAAAPARPTVGPAPELRWRRQARLAGELAAAGAFREALTLLHTQIGARCYQPLQWPLLQCAMAHRGALQLSPLPLLPPLLPSLRTGTATTPPAPLSLASLGQRARLAEACVTKGAFADAQRHWQAVVAALPLVVADSEDAAAQVRSLLGTAREYLLGMRVALEQKRCKAVAQEEAAAGAEATGRALQLAALFTHCNLQPVHMLLALRAAMKSAYEAKRLSLAAAFAHRIVDMAPEGDADTPSGAAATAAAQKMLAYCDRNMALEVTEPPIDYDERRSFRIDARTLTPVYAGASTRLCPYCQAVYAEGGEEELICVLCGIAAVGASADGLRLMRAGSGGGSG